MKVLKLIGLQFQLIRHISRNLEVSALSTINIAMKTHSLL